MTNLIREIHRRSLWQVLGIYLAASWVALQAADTLTASFGLPDWVPQLAVVLLIIGLPIVLATAFVQEGLGRSPAVAEVSSPAAAGEGAGASEPAPAGDTEEAPVEAEVKEATAEPGVHHKLFTWRNALAGGVLAFALLGMVTAGYMAMRTLGIGPAGTLVAKGVLEERATVLVAQFESADSLVADAATIALQTDLAQSPTVMIADPAFTAEALRRMEREPTEPVDASTALELARREGLPAVIEGEVTPAGTGYVLSARLISAESGEALVSHRETAADDSEVIPAIDRLSKRLRERIGEPLKSVRASPPLERVTTASLDALQKYSQAYRLIETEGEFDRALVLLDEALALDTAFAMAYRKLGTQLMNLGIERDRAFEALTRAFEHRDRLTEPERYHTEGSYHLAVTQDYSRARAAYENLLEIDPDDGDAMNNLGVIQAFLRDFSQAEKTFEQSLRLHRSSSLSYTNLAEMRLHNGDVAQALATLDTAAALFPDNPSVRWYDGQVAAARGVYDTAATILRSLRDDLAGDPFWEAGLSSDLAALAATRGVLGEAEALIRDAMRVNEENGQGVEYVGDALEAFWLDALVRSEPERGLADLEAALERHPLSEVAPLSRPYLPLAEAYAAAGDAERARRLVAEYEAEVPSVLWGDRRHLYRARGAIALAEERFEESVDAFRRSDRGECFICALPGLARAYEEAGVVDSALAVYERYAATPFIYRHWADYYPMGPALGPTYERLGRLYDAQGDLENAAKYYAAFVELWEEADPELQPRVEAARARLEEILSERG